MSCMCHPRNSGARRKFAEASQAAAPPNNINFGCRLHRGGHGLHWRQGHCAMQPTSPLFKQPPHALKSHLDLATGIRLSSKGSALTNVSWEFYGLTMVYVYSVFNAAVAGGAAGGESHVKRYNRKHCRRVLQRASHTGQQSEAARKEMVP